jgi:hypothetical protein
MDRGIYFSSDASFYQFRCNLVQIANGTNASTVKCQMWGSPANEYGNSDAAIASTDNIEKNTWSEPFCLHSGGTKVYISSCDLGGGLSGVPKMAWGFTKINTIDATFIVNVYAANSYINIEINDDGANQDWTVAVDSGYVQVFIYYLTTA